MGHLRILPASSFSGSWLSIPTGMGEQSASRPGVSPRIASAVACHCIPCLACPGSSPQPDDLLAGAGRWGTIISLEPVMDFEVR